MEPSALDDSVAFANAWLGSSYSSSYQSPLLWLSDPAHGNVYVGL